MSGALGDPMYVDRTYEVYKTGCPGCGYPLEWAVVTPPIPMTLYHWYDPNGEGQQIEECPGCGEPLPEGDLTADVAQLEERDLAKVEAAGSTPAIRFTEVSTGAVRSVGVTGADGPRRDESTVTPDDTILTDDEIATLNAARDVLAQFGKRCSHRAYDADMALFTGHANAADYGRVHALAEVAEHAIFDVFNWTKNHRVRPLTDEQLHNRKPEPVSIVPRAFVPVGHEDYPEAQE